ncbi:hypothetical protein AgCh_014865 [Apium graveolens]
MFPAKAFVEDVPLLYNKEISNCDSAGQLSLVPNNSIIICENKNSTVYDMVSLIANSNAVAAIIISDEQSVLGDDFPYPGVLINPKEGLDVIKGPAPSCPGILKPDIMAPGTLVSASWNPKTPSCTIARKILLSSDFNAVSGTSMSCPLVSGLAALLKGAHPEWSPAGIRSAMMTTANPLDNSQQQILDVGTDFGLATPLAMGAGQIDPNRALHPGIVYDATPQDYVNFLCSINFTRNQIYTITRSNFSCLNPTCDLNYPSFISLYNSTLATGGITTVHYHKRTVTNVGDGAATYKAQVSAPKGSVVTISPDVLVFGKTYEKISYSISLAFTGDRNGTVTFGSLTWIEENSKYSVRSPIVISPMVNPW